MKIVKKESVNEVDVKSVIIDSTLFTGGQDVEGVAFCKNFKEATTESGKHYIKLYLCDKGHRMFQANLMNINKNNTRTETINGWVGNPLILKGNVSHFMGMNIVNILSIEKVKEGIYTEEDFIPVAKNLEEEVKVLKEFVDGITDEDLTEMKESINRLAVPKALSKAIIKGDNCKIGDGLLICNRMLQQLESISKEESRIEVDLYKVLIILSTGIFYSLNSNSAKNPSTVDTSTVDDLIICMDIINKNNIFGNSNKDRCLKEVKHLYSVMYMDEEPKTFLSKFFKTTEHTIKSNLEIARMESRTTSGNSYRFGEIDYVRI